jgi:hypothetical protein
MARATSLPLEKAIEGSMEAIPWPLMGTMGEKDADTMFDLF